MAYFRKDMAPGSNSHTLVPVIHVASDLPNDVLLSALSAAVGAARTRTASYDWSPDQYVCYIYYEVLFAVLEHTVPLSFPVEHLNAFCSAASSAHADSTVKQYAQGLLRLFFMVAPYESALGTSACLLPLSLSFAMFYVAERFLDCSANRDSIRKEFAGLLFLHTQLGFPCVLNTPLFDSAFAGYNRGLTAFSDLAGRRGLHPSTVRMVIDVALSPESGPALIEACALLLFSYLFWFRPISFMALKWKDVTLMPNSSIQVHETARKATGASAAQRQISRTKVVLRSWAFAPASVFETFFLRFIEGALKRMSSAKAPPVFLSHGI